jgi:small-conductance mechanosensitive channel
MRTKIYLILIVLTIFSMNSVNGQNDINFVDNDSINNILLLDYNKKLIEIEQQRVADSIKKVELEEQLKTLKTTDNIQKEKLLQQIKEIEEQEQQRITLKKQRIDSLKITAIGYPVVGIYKDTLFLVYNKMGASKPKDRAINITHRIEKLFDYDFLKIDSITFVDAEYTYDIVYGETIIMSISETDALWQNMMKHELARTYTEIIKNDLIKAKDESRLSRMIMRIGLLLLVLISVVALLLLINRFFKKLTAYFELNKDKWLRSLAYKDYTFLTEEQEYKAILFLFKPLRWFIYAIILYIAIPIIFSIFPFTRNWADDLFHLVWNPFKSIFIAVWDYLPNLFTILVIYFVMKYVIRFVKYIFSEIESEKLKISGFHSDWAMPTFSIIKFLLYAFMFILIFPYLPGSDSDIFKGVSVFLGILFSLGSSTAIANMVAGLVITYMRPFKIGDRIKIGDVFGDVEEKTLLVTRIKTPKNEIITIPNSAILSGNTTNYSSEVVNNGLILHTTVTIGYDVPWKDMYKTLIDAALRTEHILQDPKPFVLQTSLEDFYVAYQINAYTKEVKKQAIIYSNLHQNIQDVCNERGIEILSPHYRAARDGNMTTIPADYLDKDYKTPSFNVKVETAKDK